MTRSDITQCSWNSPAALAGNTGLYLSRSVSARQPGWLQNLWTDAGTSCVHCTNTCRDTSRCDQRLEAVSASLTHGQAYRKTLSTKQLVNGESSYVQAWRQNDITLNICSKNAHFSEPTHYTTGSFKSHRQSTEENALRTSTSNIASRTIAECCHLVN